jgi:hypothetical protein
MLVTMRFWTFCLLRTLGFDKAKTCRWIQTFRRNILPPPSGSKNMEHVWYLHTILRWYNPEDHHLTYNSCYDILNKTTNRITFASGPNLIRYFRNVTTRRCKNMQSVHRLLTLSFSANNADSFTSYLLVADETLKAALPAVSRIRWQALFWAQMGHRVRACCPDKALKGWAARHSKTRRIAPTGADPTQHTLLYSSLRLKPPSSLITTCPACLAKYIAKITLQRQKSKPARRNE